jgi:hypothetical protein
VPREAKSGFLALTETTDSGSAQRLAGVVHQSHLKALPGRLSEKQAWTCGGGETNLRWAETPAAVCHLSVRKRDRDLRSARCASVGAEHSRRRCDRCGVRRTRPRLQAGRGHLSNGFSRETSAGFTQTDLEFSSEATYPERASRILLRGGSVTCQNDEKWQISKSPRRLS